MKNGKLIQKSKEIIMCYEIGCCSSWQVDDDINLFGYLTTKSLDVDRDVSTAY